MNPASNFRDRLPLVGLGAAVVGIVGCGFFWLQTILLPPLVNDMGWVPLRPFFLAGAGGIFSCLWLTGWALFGQRARWWHGVIYVFFGSSAGFIDGFYFLWLFGSAIGMVCGGVIGVLVTLLRGALHLYMTYSPRGET